MRVPRLLVCSLMISLSCAAAAAQSTPNRALDSSQPRITLIPNPEIVASPLDSPTPHILTLEQDDATCYTLRTYRVARENPHSDSTRPAGYSTCRRATRFQLRTAVDSREMVPR